MAEETGNSIKVYENRLRRIARRQGLVLIKTRTRDPRAVTYGGWRILDIATGGFVSSGDRLLRAEEVEKILNAT